MKNSKNRGIVHFKIFRWNGRFLGICLETGFVEEANNFKDIERKLMNGLVVLLGAVHKSKQNLEPSLNTRPPFKYLVFYYLAPILNKIELIRAHNHNGEWNKVYFISKPISAFAS